MRLLRCFGPDDVELLSATQIQLTEQLFCERAWCACRELRLPESVSFAACYCFIVCTRCNFVLYFCFVAIFCTWAPSYNFVGLYLCN